MKIGFIGLGNMGQPMARKLLHAMSTIGVELSGQLAQAHERAGHGYVAAPVFGRPEAAAQGILSITVASPADQVESYYPILETLGQDIIVLDQEATRYPPGLPGAPRIR